MKFVLQTMATYCPDCHGPIKGKDAALCLNTIHNREPEVVLAQESKEPAMLEVQVEALSSMHDVLKMRFAF